MAAVSRRRPDTVLHIYTTIDRRFFADSLDASFRYHPLQTDVGMVQKTPFSEDLPATIERLGRFYPCDGQLVQDLTRQLTTCRCRLIVCDIAPLGIAVGRQAGIATVLVENFTWDWVYAGYRNYQRELAPFCRYLRELFAAADFHLQTRPVCRPAAADITTDPISRLPRTDAVTLRRRLGIPPGAPLVVVTLGGTSRLFAFSDFSVCPDVYVVIPGGAETLTVEGRLIRLPSHGDIFHPDLIHAADAVVGKVGYSTLAEVYAAGVPFGYVTRPGFRESAVLERFVARHMPSLQISKQALETGLTAEILRRLLSLPRSAAKQRNGAGPAGDFICGILEGSL